MKKKKRSLSLLTCIGIGVFIGFTAALWDLITFVIPFERSWITYALLIVLFVMAIHISRIWNRSNNKGTSATDIDEYNAQLEKIAYRFVGSTSLYLIIGMTGSFITILEWDDNKNFFSNIIIVLFLSHLFFGIFAQIQAVKFHNRHNPGAIINIKRTNGYEEYFTNLDEGEKFEQYKVAYKSFYAMNLLFPVTLLILFMISTVSSPQYVAISIVGILWFIMYIIYYREGAKSH